MVEVPHRTTSAPIRSKRSGLRPSRIHQVTHPGLGFQPVTDETRLDVVKGGTERNASTLELFFDLVYVFAIIQVVGFIHQQPTAAGLAQGAFLLWLLWWTWSMYTWTTNWTGTSSTSTRLFLLGAMGTTLLMALAVPEAFGDSSRWFAVTYFTVRSLASGLYWFASKSHPEQRAAFYTFFPLAGAASFLVLVGGFLEPPWLGVLWGAGAVLDIVGAVNAGKGSWAIDPKHFAERNGLFIIIALGESVVGLGLAASGAERDISLITVLAIGFVGVAALWWSYFDRAAPRMEAHLTRLTGRERGRFARDAYSVLHYPLVVGIVFYALALEDVLTHPTDPIPPQGRFAMSVGVALVLLSVVASAYRAVRRIPTERLAAALVLIAMVWLAGSLDAQVFAAIVTTILVVSLVAEHIHFRDEPDPGS